MTTEHVQPLTKEDRNWLLTGNAVTTTGNLHWFERYEATLQAAEQRAEAAERSTSDFRKKLEEFMLAAAEWQEKLRRERDEARAEAAEAENVRLKSTLADEELRSSVYNDNYVAEKRKNEQLSIQLASAQEALQNVYEYLDQTLGPCDPECDCVRCLVEKAISTLPDTEVAVALRLKRRVEEQLERFTHLPDDFAEPVLYVNELRALLTGEARP